MVESKATPTVPSPLFSAATTPAMVVPCAFRLLKPVEPPTWAGVSGCASLGEPLMMTLFEAS